MPRSDNNRADPPGLLRSFFLMPRLPSSAEEGWLREVRMPRSDRSRADGVVLIRKLRILLNNTTPSAPSKVAAPFLFDVAATPPQLRRGAALTQTFC